MMKKADSNVTPTKPRNTLNRQIASAPTRAAKWEIAITGGLPEKKIQTLAWMSVFWGFHTERPRKNFSVNWLSI